MLEKSKIKKKQVLYDICGIIIKDAGGGNYEILIAKNYKKYDLYKFDICIANAILLKKIDIDIWNNILNKTD